MVSVVKLLNELGENDAVKLRVTDYRVTKMEMVKNSWSEQNKTVPWDRHTFPAYFFSRQERRFLEGVQRDFPPGGQFEGVNWTDEETANSLLKVSSDNSLWRMAGGEETVVTSEGLDRREFIPRVRHTIRCLTQRGTLWWNPRKSQLPMNFVDRRMCPTAKVQEFAALFEVQQNEENDIKPFSASEILQQTKSLVLFVDPPGMGKSSAMTKLELQLRSEMSSSPRVIVRLNLNQKQRILRSQGSDMEIPDKPHNLLSFIEKFVENIPVSLLEQTFPVRGIPLYVLLDGLDEVCPEYEHIMTRILRNLLSDTPQRLFIVQKVILTTRQHLQTLIEEKFSVKANSLLPFKYEEQVEFLKREVEVSFEARKSLASLPSTARSLMTNPLMLSLYAEILNKSPGTETVVNIFDLYTKFVEAKDKWHVVEKEKAEPANTNTRRRLRSMLDDNLKFYFACAVEELIGSVPTKTTLGKRKASYFTVAILEQPIGEKLEELITFGLLVNGEGRFKHRSFAEFFYAQLVTQEANGYEQLREVLLGRMYEHNVAGNVERFVREILLKRQEEERGSESPESFSRSYLQKEDAALYLGKERLLGLTNGWINSLEDRGEGFEHLLSKMESVRDSTSTGSFLCSPLKEVRGELAGADDKECALRNFYSGNLFPFLCGSSVLLFLDYSDPDIFDFMKYNETTICFFLEWLCRLHDRRGVRAKVFGMKEDSLEQVMKCLEESAELILMFAVRSDNISKFFIDEDISAALNSLDSVVEDYWRVEELEVGRVRRRLEEYVDPQKLKDSLLIHLRTVDDILVIFFDEGQQRRNLEWSWWYAEVFSRKEVLSFVNQQASRVPTNYTISWRAVRYAWGAEFELLREPLWKVTYPPHEGKSLLDIKEGDLEFVTFFLDEVERGGLKPEGELMEVLKEIIFGDECGWKVLEMLEKRLVRQRREKTYANSCTSQETNILEQLFKSEEVGKRILDNIQAELRSSADIKYRVLHELRVLFAWFPFVVRYSENIEPIKSIVERIASLPSEYTTEKEYFACAARSLQLAHSSEPTGSRSRSQLICSFIEGFKRAPDSLLNVLFEVDEEELRNLIQDSSPGTPHIVSHTSLGPVLTSLLNKKKSTSDKSLSTLPLGTIMESPLNAESVAFIFTELIETSPCYKLPRALEQFLSAFPPNLIKDALLSEQAYSCFKSKRRVEFRKHVFVNTEGLCSLLAAIRVYFVVFGEDLRWIKSKQAHVNLLIEIPVEILSVLEDEVETVVGGIPHLPTEVRLSLVSQIEEELRRDIKIRSWDRLDWLAERFSYNTETDWVQLLQALHLIPKDNCCPMEPSSALLDHNHHYINRVESRLLLIRVWIKYFGAEETRRAADEQKLWEWLRDVEEVPRGEYLHVAVEVGSLEGVKTLSWPGLLKWKNPSGKTAGEVAVELWKAHHEISRFLAERFQAVRAFHDDP